ncbi:hypothetical protein BSL78_06523 [Apostichopus japonicus]|uniref:Endonuclease/exonuclease/phosphatase domain-containing protein n=1 Tax=Stichopus japonicus TaxID=307972 RepID=A0A2G8L8N0_STIJA|nr:hypothetical protein BSL78_06523 [Apostichopus japonicus]
MPNLCFIALQETKLQTVGNKWEGENVQHQVADEALQLQNFHMFRQDRGFTANGGGLMTYISKEWSIKAPKVCFTFSTPDIELLAVRDRFLPSDISNMTIVNVYTRPSANFTVSNAALKNALTSILMENPRSYIIIVGDLNRDRLPFLETMGYNNLVNFVTFPRSNTILDAVYVKGWSYFTAKKMHPIATSDHFSVLIMPRYTERYREARKDTKTKGKRHQEE